MTTTPSVAAGRRHGGAVRRRGRGEVSMVPDAEFTSYYGHPVLKKPVWKREIAAYFFAGGLAGASMLLAGVARLRGDDTVARRATLTALGAVAVSPPLLIADLGRPERFHNMLRVMKVSSPMSVGTWILSGAGACTGVAAACDILGVMPRVRAAAEAGAAVLGPALSTYTAALVADTAVPVWHEARHELPVIFGATSLATAGAASILLNPVRVSAPARALCAGGAVASMTAMEVMEQRLGDLAEPYRTGPVNRLRQAARGLSTAGAATVLAGRKQRVVASLGAAAVLAGALAERWTIFRVGHVSTEDPRYTIAPQRERLDRGIAWRQSEQLGPPPDGAVPAYVSAPPLARTVDSERS